MNKRAVKIIIATCLLLSSIVFPANARVVVDSVESNGIKIEYGNDGYYNISSSYTDGKILYFTRHGVSQETLKSDVYLGDVKFYNEDGSFSKEVNYPVETEIYSMSDYSNWQRWGYTLDTSRVTDSSDFMKSEGCKVIKPTLKDTDFKGWQPCYTGDVENGVGYFEVIAVYEHSDGTYSNPVSKIFMLNTANIEASITPVLTASEVERTNNYVMYSLNYDKGLSDYDLKNITVTNPDGHTESLSIDTDFTSIKYKAIKNGTYTFTLSNKGGKYCSVSVNVSGISYKIGDTVDEMSRQDLEVTVTGVPDSATLGDRVVAHLHTNLLCNMSYNGSVIGKQDADLEVTDNGVYIVHMVDDMGISYDYKLNINCFADEESNATDTPQDSTSYWSSSSSSPVAGEIIDENKLPQTGGLFYKTGLVIGLVLILLGSLLLGMSLLFKVRRRTDE